MSNIPEQLRYATSHEWIKVDGDTGTVGITDHAQHLVKKPELVNQDPYGAAWLFRIKLSAPAEVDALKDAAGYKAQIGE